MVRYNKRKLAMYSTERVQKYLLNLLTYYTYLLNLLTTFTY